MGLVDEETTKCVIGAFFEVYNTLRYGFVEHIYESALAIEMKAKGLFVARQVPKSVNYKGAIIGVQRIDMLVNDRVIVEIKATEHLPPPARQQLRSYLRATNLEVGLLLHFGPEAKFYREINSNFYIRADSADQH